MKKILLSLILIVITEIADAQIYVDASATGANNGTSWANAYSDLQQAIYNAPTGSKIWVKQGNYKPSINVSGVLPAIKLRSFWLKNGVEVYGGFNGTEIEFNQRNINSQKAVLDGQVDPTNKAYHVLSVSALSTAKLDGFIVQNGNSTGGSGAGVSNSGAGLYLTGSAQFFNIEFKNNVGYDHGGAVFASGSTSIFVNCRFENNSTTLYDGGALYLSASSNIQLYNCVLFNNTATRYGAAIVSTGTTTVLMQNNTVINNIGGNVFQASATSTINIKQSILWGNTNATSIVSSSAINFTECIYQWAAAGNNINTDPLLVNIPTGDLKLSASSPAINTFTTNPVNPYYDIAGNQRKVGSSIDIGAYEYNSGQAQLVYVDKDATGSNNGTSWANAYNKVSDALNNSTFSQNEEIWIAEGIYTPDASNRNIYFNLPHQAKMYGGFNGTESQRSQRDSKINIVRLSGDLNGNDNTTIDYTDATRQDNSYHILYVTGAKSGIIIDGLTISNANANGTSNENTAGVIMMVHTGANNLLSVSFNDIIIEKNTAINAAIFQSFVYFTQGSTSELNLSKCVVRNNNGSSVLGNMLYVGHRTYNQKTYGTITNTLFYKNTCLSGTATIYNKVNGGSGVVTPVYVRNCTFSNNAGNGGQVIYLNNTGDSKYINNIFYGNGSGTPIGWSNSGAIATVFNNCISEDPAFGLNQNPLFKNSANDDYTLDCSGNSPAINAGNSSGILSTEKDFSGKPRLVSTVDIGAYEYQNKIAITASSPSVCIGGSVTLNANYGTGISWSNGINNGAAFSPTISQTYSVTGINENLCADQASITIIVNETPTITVNSGSICAGNSFTIIPGGANTYTIQGGSAIKTPTANASYTVVGTSSVGCVSNTFATSDVTVNARPIITTNNGSICAGNSFTIIPGGASTYTIQGGSAIKTPTANASYTVVGTSSVGCVSQTFATSNVTVNTLPVINTVSNQTLLCAGQTTSLTASGASTYTWNSGATTSDIAISPTVTTSYTVNGTDGNGCMNTSVITQSVSTCTGINQIATTGNEITIFPNPFNDKVIVNTSLNFTKAEQTIYVYNSLGSVVYSAIIANEKTEIDLSNQSSGIYFIKVMIDGVGSIHKVIKQ